MPLPKLPGDVTAGADRNTTFDRVHRLAAMHWFPVITASTAGASAITVVWKLLFSRGVVDVQTWATIVSAMTIVFQEPERSVFVTESTAVAPARAH